jgi:hypothetical protein
LLVRAPRTVGLFAVGFVLLRTFEQFFKHKFRHRQPTEKGSGGGGSQRVATGLWAAPLFA